MDRGLHLPVHIPCPMICPMRVLPQHLMFQAHSASSHAKHLLYNLQRRRLRSNSMHPCLTMSGSRPARQYHIMGTMVMASIPLQPCVALHQCHLLECQARSYQLTVEALVGAMAISALCNQLVEPLQAPLVLRKVLAHHPVPTQWSRQAPQEVTYPSTLKVVPVRLL